jgi:hypothetical protein
MASPSAVSAVRVQASAASRTGPRSPVLYCLLYLLILEVISRTVVANLAYGPTDAQIQALNTALAAWKTAPRVVFLGPSYIQAGVATVPIEQQLGWPAGTIINAGLSSARPRDALQVYRTHRSLFRSAKQVYVAIDLTSFNLNTVSSRWMPMPVWRRQATIADRLRFPGSLATKTDLLVGWAFTTWDQRTTWRSELVGLVLKGLGRPRGARGRHLYDALGRPAMGRRHYTMTAEWLASDVEQVAYRHLYNYRFDSEGFASVDTLVHLIREDGAEPIFITMPLPQPFTELIRSDHASIHEELSREVRRRHPDIGWVTLDTSDFAPDDFQDGDHLSTKGALRLAGPLAAAIAARFDGRSVRAVSNVPAATPTKVEPEP